jgi:hypothetical protein
MKKSLFAVQSVLVFLCFLTPGAFAEDQPAIPEAKIAAPAQAPAAAPASGLKVKENAFAKGLDKYGARCAEKLDFGVPNLLMGWTVVISEPVTHYKKTESRWNNTKQILGLVGKGLLLFPIDMAGGALNFATFLIPGKIPLPKNGVNTEQLIGDADHLKSNASTPVNTKNLKAA